MRGLLWVCRALNTSENRQELGNGCQSEHWGLTRRARPSHRRKTSRLKGDRGGVNMKWPLLGHREEGETGERVKAREREWVER